MTAAGRQQGQASIDYLAITGIVVILLGGLLVLGEGKVSRRPPLDPFRVLADPVRSPPVVRTRSTPRRPPAPRVDRRPVVVAPRWALP